MNIETECRRDLGPWLTNSFGDRYLYEVNRNGLNRDGAEMVHRSRFGTMFRQENTLVVVVGTDSGTLLRSLATLDVAAGTRILFLELPQVLERLREDAVLEDLPEQTACRAYDDFAALAEEFRFKDYLYIDAVLLTLSLAAQDAYLPGYQELFWQLQVDLNHFKRAIHGGLGTEDFIVRQLENLGDNVLSAQGLRGTFLGATAVLLAGGPSLDDVLPWVEVHREELVVLAVSRCARRLLEVGLLPDIVFSIDPHQVSFDVSKEMLRLHHGSLFVHMYHVTPLLLGQWRGRAMYLGDRFPWASERNEASLPTPGPTVSNVALATAMEMGFAQIVLAGVDLCHSREGYTHAKGSNERSAGPQLGHVCTRVETNGGWMAESTSDFATAIEVLASQAGEASRRGIRLINPAPGAARVAEVLHLPLSDVTIQPPHRPVAEILAELAPKRDRAGRMSHLRAMREELTAMYGQLVQIKQLVVEANRCLDSLFGTSGRQRNFKHKLRLDKIEKTLNRRHAPAVRLVKTFGIRDFLRLTRVNAEAEWDEEEMERTGRAYYKAYQDSTRRLTDLVTRCRERLVSRLAEEDEHADLESLASRWRADQQPGRALLWRDRNPEAQVSLSAGGNQLLADLEQEFEAVLTESDTGHMRRSRQFASLESIRAKAQMLFRQENREGLEQLARGLVHHPDMAAGHLVLLASGYLAELVGDANRALELYEQLLGAADEKVLEEGVRRIASICIEQGALGNAQLALEALTNISPAYMVQLAELCWLGGDQQQALHVLLDYLEVVPVDLGAMVRLAKYYRAMGMEDGAQAMLRHVLAQAPDNVGARAMLNASGQGGETAL